MKKDKNAKRTKRIYLRLKPEEYKILEAGFNKTTMRKLSEYTRNILLKGPVTVYTRNKSYDEGIEAMAGVMSELNAIGRNMNQAVKKLNSMSHDEEIKGWAVLTQKNKELFDEKVSQIELKMAQIAKQWSQE